MKKIMYEQKPWLSNYPDGVPNEINPEKYENLIELFDDAFAKNKNHIAYKCLGKELTFSDWDLISKKISAFIQSFKIQPKSKVAIMLPNLLQNPIIICAVIRAGFIVVNVNPLYSARELNHQLKDSKAEAIFLLDNFSEVLEKAIDDTQIKHVVTTSVGDLLGLRGVFINLFLRHIKRKSKEIHLVNEKIKVYKFNKVLKSKPKNYIFPKEIKTSDAVCLQYTGGTTGVSKGAVLTHKNLVANCLQAEAWYKPALEDMNYDPGKPTSSINQQSVIICSLPLYHIFAFTACLLLGLKSGMKNLLIPNPRDFKGFVKTLKKESFHIFPGVNTLFNGLMNQKGFDSLDFSNLRISLGGGMAVTKTVAERWQRITGCPMIEGYGLSETSPVATVVSVNAKNYTGNVGLPVSSTLVRIADEQEKTLNYDEVGEILIKGPQIMQGYWNNKHETEQVFSKDGFFKTGDLGTMDEGGFVKIVDRKKDMINVSGFNVYPNEVEQVVSSNPMVLECAVVGSSDVIGGELVRLFVVPKQKKLTRKDLISFCRQNLAAYKCPKEIIFMEELPKTNVGKILRRKLR
ncbi:MAG: long-chain fatty acid--CoA ligase [Betaproteobacteria bacterium TMED156]|nr:MAG: long-chain fatty acid--CoA ligase [Betaproteobacteria bacterium TMED156]